VGQTSAPKTSTDSPLSSRPPLWQRAAEQHIHESPALGCWWEDRRQLIQPSNFVLNGSGKVLSATYSSGPIGRLEAADAIRFIEFQEKQKKA
jgi:hypothetical protein